MPAHGPTRHSHNDYVVTGVSRAYHSHAMRSAVLTPLFGVKWSENFPAKVASAVGSLRKLWFLRLTALTNAGWPPVAQPIGLTMLANCPPFGVTTETRSRTCLRVPICPFCYARRYVRNGFLALAGAVERVGEPPPGWGFLAYTTRWHSDVSVEQYAARLASFKHDPGAAKRRYELDKIEAVLDPAGKRKRPLSAAMLYKAWPTDKGLTMVRAGVVAVPLELPLLGSTTTEKTCRTVKVYPDLTKASLAKAVGWAFSYPGKLLTGDPALVVPFLAGLKRCRLFSTYGLARGRAQETL